MKTKTLRIILGLFGLLALPMTGAALAADQAQLEAGETYVVSLSEDGQELHRAEYLASLVQGAEDSSAVMLLPQEEVWNTESQGTGSEFNKITAEEAAEFLAANDLRADQYATWLGEYNLSFAQLMKLMQEHQGADSQLIGYLDRISQFSRGYTDTNLPQFCQFLELLDLDTDEFFTLVESAYGSVDAFLDLLDNTSMDFDALYGAYLRSGAASFEQFLQPASSASHLPQYNAASAEEFNPMLVFELIEVWVETWQFLCPTGPIASVDGAFSRVLHKDGHSTLAYRGAKESKTPRYTYQVTMKPHRTMLIVEFSGKAFYDARHMSLPGKWLPLVCFEVHRVEVVYAGWQVKRGVAKLFPPHSNQGTTANPDPRCHFLVQIETNQGIQKHYMFRVQGSKGISFLGG